MKFVWSESSRFVVGAGGTENHTIERAKELNRRGIAVELIIIARTSYPVAITEFPVTFHQSAKLLSQIDDTIVYIARGHDIPTKQQSYIYFHFPIAINPDNKKEKEFLRACRRSKIITNSKFAQGYWSKRLDIVPSLVSVVYPFALPIFGEVDRSAPSKITHVLYPNRIQAEKGLFVFLEAASCFMNDQRYKFTITGAGNQTTTGAANERWLKHVPYVTYLPPVDDPRSMAALYAKTDIAVVPSRDDVWEEPFGMISVEAQASGCRVIASESGGLRETDCGLADFIPAGNAFYLRQTIEAVSNRSPVSAKERGAARSKFTIEKTVDSFLAVVAR